MGREPIYCSSLQLEVGITPRKSTTSGFCQNGEARFDFAMFAGDASFAQVIRGTTVMECRCTWLKTLGIPREEKIANVIACLKAEPRSKRAIIPIPFPSEG